MAGRRVRAWHVVLGATYGYVLACAFSAYRAGAFGYHDLTLLNDLFSSTLHDGRFFWSAEENLSHFRVHFTPTLLLLLPLFELSSSQFLLVGLGVTALFAGLAFQVKIFEQLLARAGALPIEWSGPLGAAWALVLALNPYAKAVALSAHFEVFFFLLASAALYALLTGARWFWVAGAAALAVGVRPDGAMFLACHLLACLALPAVLLERSRSRTRLGLGVALGALAYLVLVLTLVQPALGASGGTRFWSHYGATWPEVGWVALTHPGRVIADVRSGAWALFNRSFFWVQLLCPLTALGANLPSVFFFIADAPDKRGLWYYNSAFVLPGAMVAASGGVVRLASLLGRLERRFPAAARARWLLWVGMGVAVALSLARVASTPAGPRLEWKSERVDLGLLAAFDADVAPCANRRSVAADFKQIVFVPNGYERHLLKSYPRAEIVLVGRQPDPFLLGAPTGDQFFARIGADPGFSELSPVGDVRVFVRADARECQPRR